MADDDDLVTCESCDKRHTWEETTRSADGCHICPECQAAWQAEFRACAHEWEACDDEYGDPAHACRRCYGLVRDEDFPRMFGRAAPPQAEAGS